MCILKRRIKIQSFKEFWKEKCLGKGYSPSPIKSSHFILSLCKCDMKSSGIDESSTAYVTMPPPAQNGKNKNIVTKIPLIYHGGCWGKECNEKEKTKSMSSLLNMLIIKKGSLCKSILCTYQDLYISALLPFKSCSAQWAKLLFWCDWGWQYNFGLQNVQALIQENTSQGSNHDRRIISQSWGRKSRLQCCRQGGAI